MCSLFESKFKASQLRQQLDTCFVTERDLSEAKEHRPTDPVLIITHNSDGYFPSHARWSLMAEFHTYQPEQPISNIRSEGLASRPNYGKLLQRNRCLIPASAFYEWQGERGFKVKWKISHVDDEPLLFAGLFAHHPFAGNTCAILTTAANGVIDGIHDRMPVILDPKDCEAWLRYRIDGTAKDFQSLLKPCADEMLRIQHAEPHAVYQCDLWAA